MRAASDGLPVVGRSARELGVRVEGAVIDLRVGEDGWVQSGAGGMSVADGDPSYLPKHRRPLSLGGDGRDPVFGLARAALPAELAIRVDRPPHALVEPAEPCKLGRYEEALAATRPSWTRTHD